ncbi:MAG: (2Fe-2S)-binding protein [Deltaproteobacteria bacterium]|nr:(2Fe-2S)-binding protein [Deltaproteobacteria bacterium]
MIVCSCFATSERDVDATIRDGADSVDAIGERCGAGTGCGACREELAERLGTGPNCRTVMSGSAVVPLRRRVD